MNIKLPLSILATILVLTLIFTYIYSKPKKEVIYDVDILLTMFDNYFEIEGCHVRETDCRVVEGQHYLDKHKNPNKYRIPYKKGLKQEVAKLIEKGKKIHLRAVDVSSGSQSQEHMQIIKDLLKGEDAKLEFISMAKH